MIILTDELDFITQYNVYVHISKNRCYTLATVNRHVMNCMSTFASIDDAEFTYTFFFVDSLQELIQAMREFEYSDVLIKDILLDAHRLKEMTLHSCERERVYILIEQN